MFFSPELLARRDSGIGLLWLAATLGSKSTFKKLQKRNVLTADISQLCTLIAEPTEPLALRLSSNLMVGAARVYKVKQEIFLSDVMICFNSLKKMVQEFESRFGSDTQLQIVQPNARHSAMTLAADPRTAFAMEFDNLVADWDAYLNIGEKRSPNHDMFEEDEFDPNPKQARQAKKNVAKTLPASEDLRGDLHTLNENHDHLLSSSFDASFNGGSGIDLSSSQYDGVFHFDDNFFNASDGFDIGGGLGDELARELGEGWGGSPVKPRNDTTMDVDPPDLGMNNDVMEMDMNIDFGLGLDDLALHNTLEDLPVNLPVLTHPPENEPHSRTPCLFDSDKENLRPPSVPSSINTPRSAFSPANFSQSLLSQDAHQRPESVNLETQIQKPALGKYKRTRLLLDARTELTDEEMKAARAQYLELQNTLRHEIEQKRTEKNCNKIMDDMLWGIPNGIHAQALVDFWLENFKVQVEARSGALRINMCDGPPTKRRKVRNLNEHENANIPEVPFGEVDFDMGIDIGVGIEDFYDGGNVDQDHGHLRSSEEPGQARRISRPPSVLGSNFGSNIGLQDAPGGSQRSSLFPWDNAGASSSVGGAGLGPVGDGSDRISVDQAEIRLRGRESSLSRRESSLIPSQIGSATGVGFSPMAFGRLSEENFAFELPADNPVVLDSQQSDINLITLERNSFNFLEYAKMQYQTLPIDSTLAFDDIVPKLTSTRHVAAAAFYHCLVLATKDLLHLRQKDTYGAISITIV